MTQIEDLIPDIEARLLNPKPVDENDLHIFLMHISQEVSRALNYKEDKPELRMSNIGTPCERQLWYKVNQSEDSEQLPANARLKFLFGHIIEALILLLAKEAGHIVRGEQDNLDIQDVPGHRDAVIDGITVDVKSASTY